MKYKIVKKESRFGEVIDFIKTESSESIYIVERGKEYKLRRTTAAVWDISVDSYSTLLEAEVAILSGDIVFKMGR